MRDEGDIDRALLATVAVRVGLADRAISNARDFPKSLRCIGFAASAIAEAE